MTGASSEAVNHFVEAAAAPTHITGKVARWDTPICPAALGLPADEIARVVQRVKDLAAQAGVRVSGSAVCKPNIVIAFTSTPQALLDNIRKSNMEWLGYHSSSDELNRLSTITRPIQAWYSTATVDLHGLRQIDSARTDSNGRGLLVTAPCVLVGGGTAIPSGVGNLRNPSELCTKVIPNAIGVEVKGSRLTDGLRAAFDHVTIIANPPAVSAGMPAIIDYIAVLALAQINSLDTCQALPSITSLLARGCAQAAPAITPNDLGYLKAVYAASPEKLPSLQKDEIAYRMEQGITGQLFSAAAPAQPPEATAAAFGNLPSGFYPASPCEKPKKPEFKPGKRYPLPGEVAEKLGANDLGEYNRNIAEFNKAVSAYNRCAKSYIENSRYDIERILSTVNAAVAEVQGAAPPQPPSAAGNLPADFYPRSPCIRPERTALGSQPAITEISAMRDYNIKVAAFNLQVENFGTCLRAYQERARYDIQAIQVAVQPEAANPVPPSSAQ